MTTSTRLATNMWRRRSNECKCFLETPSVYEKKRRFILRNSLAFITTALFSFTFPSHSHTTAQCFFSSSRKPFSHTATFVRHVWLMCTARFFGFVLLNSSNRPAFFVTPLLRFLFFGVFFLSYFRVLAPDKALCCNKGVNKRQSSKFF